MSTMCLKDLCPLLKEYIILLANMIHIHEMIKGP